MSETVKYHVSRLGMYGAGVPRDRDGYVHLDADGWSMSPQGMEMWSTLISEGEGVSDADYLVAQWAETMATYAKAKTAEAERLIEAWQRDSV